MRKRHLLYEDYRYGLASIAIICVLPMVSPIIYVCKNNHGILPYLMIFIAIVCTLYEFSPKSFEIKDNKRLKIEGLIWNIISSVFLVYDIILLLIQADTSHDYEWYDYLLFGYVLAPLIISIIEVVFSFKNCYRSDGDPSNIVKNGNRIAIGDTVDV